MDVRISSIIIIICGFFATLIVNYFLKENDKTIPNYMTIIGTIGSMIGLLITYIQVLSLKKTSEITNSKIDETLKKVNQINLIGDLSKALKTNQEIQSYIRNDKIELAHLRTLDLKYILYTFNHNDHFKELTNDKEYQNLIKDFGIDLNSINDYLITPKRKVDFSKITNNLEGLSSFLTQFEAKIKTSAYDTTQH